MNAPLSHPPQADLKPDAGTTPVMAQFLAAKADQVDALIKRLLAMSSGLRHAVNCPAPSHMECPSFRRLLKAADDSH